MKTLANHITAFGLGFALLFATGADPAHAQRSRSRTGLAGGQAQQTMQIQRQGNGAYSNNGGWQYKGPAGNRAGTTSSGQGQWTRTDQGVNNSYNGTVTTNNGSSYDVDHNADYNYTQGEGVNRHGSTAVTNGQGDTVGSTSSSGSLGRGQGYSGHQTVTGKQGHSAARQGQAAYGQGRQSSTDFVDKSGNTRWTRSSSGGRQ